MTEREYEVNAVTSEVCDAWIAGVLEDGYDYGYGGTRMVPPDFSDADAEEALVRLMLEESHLKNQLINHALDTDLLEDLRDQLPPGYLGSKVGGGRCIMRPKARYYEILQDPRHPAFSETIAEVFKVIGARLNELGGRLKLTPDFGRFEGLADELHRFTDQVLGVRCSVGGCGGKASYTTSGILGGFKASEVIGNGRSRFTLIGAAGALGSGILDRILQDALHEELQVCDLVYDNGAKVEPPRDLPKLPSEPGKFTDDCLERGGTLIMTTYGQELENSNWKKIPPDTHLMLAHNLSLPSGESGRRLARRIAERSIFCLPGQMLTLGGALTSRLEWFWRQAHPGADFTPKKPLAHEVAGRVVAHTVTSILDRGRRDGTTPYEAMWSYAEDGG